MQSRQPYFHDVPAWHWLDSGIGWTITKISSHHCDILKSLSSNDAPPHPFESTYESHTLTRNSSSMLPKYHKPIRWFNRTNYYPIMIQPKEQSENMIVPKFHGFTTIVQPCSAKKPSPRLLLGRGSSEHLADSGAETSRWIPGFKYRMDTWYIPYRTHIWIVHDPIQIYHGYPSLAF